MDAAGQLAELCDGQACFLLCGIDQLGQAGRQLLPHRDLPEEEADGDQSLLRTVMQVSLDSPTLPVGRLDHAGTRVSQLLLCPLPIGDIPHVRREPGRSLERHTSDSHFHWKLRAVRAHAGQLDPSVQDRLLARFQMPRKSRVVPFT